MILGAVTRLSGVLRETASSYIIGYSMAMDKKNSITEITISNAFFFNFLTIFIFHLPTADWFP